MKAADQLALRIGDQIVQYCLANGLERGARLTERKLAGAFGVSRSPVRSAIKLLAGLKVLERADSGYVVALERAQLEEIKLDMPPAAAEELSMQILRDRFTGKLGESVSEADLMRDHNVTRATLMKALIKLSEEGYINRGAARGWIFNEILGSIDSYNASYEFRLAIERAAMCSPNFRADEAALQRLLERHHAMLESLPDIDRSEWFALNSEFHETLVAFSGNEFFLRAIRGQNRLRRALEIETSYAPAHMKASLGEHVAILEALLGGDREWAATLLRRHLQVASESTQNTLTK